MERRRKGEGGEGERKGERTCENGEKVKERERGRVRGRTGEVERERAVSINIC